MERAPAPSSSSRGRGEGQARASQILVWCSHSGPLFAQLLRFAISRKKFLADSTAAEFTGYPEGLPAP